MTTTGTTAPLLLPTFRGIPYLDTQAVCPGCDQFITVVFDGRCAVYTECGGMDNGGCNAWIDGDEHCQRMHSAAHLMAGVLVESFDRGTTSCLCFAMDDVEKIVQPVGDCPWHGDVVSATQMAYTDPEDEFYPNGI